MRTSGKAAKELELRLLVVSQEVHTESGAHAIELSTWEAFAKRAKQRLSRITPAKARADLESVVAKMNASFGANATLPW